MILMCFLRLLADINNFPHESVIFEIFVTFVNIVKTCNNHSQRSERFSYVVLENHWLQQVICVYTSQPFMNTTKVPNVTLVENHLLFCQT